MFKLSLIIKTHLYGLTTFIFMVALLCPSWVQAETVKTDSTVNNNILILQAESEQNKEKSITLWQQVLARIADRTEPENPAISSRYIRAAIVRQYLGLLMDEKDIDHLEKAMDFSAELKDKNERAWIDVDILNQITNQPELLLLPGTLEIVNDLIDQIEMDARDQTDETQKSRLFYALLFALTKTKDDKALLPDTLVLAHPLMVEVTDPRHRQQLYQRLARLVETYPSIIPSSFIPLYSLLGKEDVKSEELILLSQKAYQKDQFDLAIAGLTAIKDKGDRADAMINLFNTVFDQNDISRARRVAEKIDNPQKAVDAWTTLAGFYLINGNQDSSIAAYERATNIAKTITKEESQKKALDMIERRRARDLKKSQKKSKLVSEIDQETATEALDQFNQGDIAAATETARTISDAIFRTLTFRQLAEGQARLNDHYGIIRSVDQNAPENTLYKLSSTSQRVTPDVRKINAMEREIGQNLTTDPQVLIFREGLKSTIGETLSYDPLPARLKVTGADIRNMIPLSGPSEFEISYYENNLFNSKFFEAAGNASYIKWQQTSAPLSIIIENGVTDIPALYDYLVANGYDDFMTRQGKIYTLRRPLVVNPHATLVITGADVDELRMSTETGTYLVNVGRVFISDTKLTAWNETTSSPQFATYENKRMFRPYFTGWSQSESFIGTTHIVGIGYANGKSYGLSFSAGPNSWFKFGNPPLEKRPTAVIVDNSFENALYGFYSYEADDVVLSGNEYINNIVYGVDPHDRSHRLAIGYNTAYDTQKKHGIIISREVNDSLIMGNLSFHNKGTGIMLDRDSNGTLVYANTAFQNKQEGMTLFESDCQIIAANDVFENHGAGFRIRNSYNVALYHNDIRKNGGAGISAYGATLKGDPVHQHRDFELDPYDEITTITAVGNRITANNAGLNIQAIEGIFLKNNQFIDQSPKVLRGEMFKGEPDALFRYDDKKFGVSAQSTCPSLPEPLKVHRCKYRLNGDLMGDGFDQITERVKISACAKSTIDMTSVPEKGHHE